jgi:hypothetical protein
VLDAVDHHDRRPLRIRRRAQRQFFQSADVGGRVGEQQVLEPLVGEPQGLGQGEGHQPLKARVLGEDRPQQRPAAQRLRSHPDRLLPGAPQHLLRIRPHRLEVDEGKRRLDLGEDLLVELVRLRGRGGHRASLSAGPNGVYAARMAEAYFGLAGVLIGSAITWGMELWRARRGDSDQARVAARLVIDELRSIANLRTAEEPEFKRQRDLALKQEAWHSQRPVLARELSYEGWRAVGAAYDSLSSPQRSSAGEHLVDERYEEAMQVLEPVATRRRYWWRRLLARG